MTTHSIKLPPLPRPQVPRIDADIDLMDIRRLVNWCEKTANEHARAAVAADRQRIADQFHKDGFYDGVILGLQAMAACGNAFNADYVELLRSAGVHETVKRAMKEGLYELAGLDSNASEDLRKEIDSTRKEFTQKIIYGSIQNEHT